MTASKIPVGGTDKDLQTWENDLGDGPVHTEAQTPTDTTGVAFGLLNPQDVRDASPRITRRLDAQDLLGDALFGIVGGGENIWEQVFAHVGAFASPPYAPNLDESVGFVGPTFARMQDPAIYGGQPFFRFSCTGGDVGGWITIGTVVDVRPNTQYDVSALVFSEITEKLSLVVSDNQASVDAVLDDHSSGAYLYQAQRYSGKFRTEALTSAQYRVFPKILIYVAPGVEEVTVIDVLEFGMREVAGVTVRAAAKPADWDYSEVTSRTADYQPLVTEYYFGGSGGILVATATCTYDEPVSGTFVLTSLEWT